MLVTRSEQGCFGGRQGFYEMPSEACASTMRFGVFLPKIALEGQKVPAIYALSGLTCTEETFAIKANAQRFCEAFGVALVTTDTSPRGVRFEGDDAHWDFGQGAGFYLDATQEPWSKAYNMHTHVVFELPAFVEAHFPISSERRSIMGHSMGGHGALVAALRHPGRYQSVSALAPISSPSVVPWGQKAFSHYLGEDKASWAQWDASELVKVKPFAGKILIDQGLKDNFLERELQPERFAAICEQAGQALDQRLHSELDHSYWFIQSVIEAHIMHHAEALNR